MTEDSENNLQQLVDSLDVLAGMQVVVEGYVLSKETGEKTPFKLELEAD